MTARQTLLDGLARDVDIFELESELVPLHPRDNNFPGEVFLRLAADALDWCGAWAPRCPWRGYASGSRPNAPSAAGKTPSSSTQCWPQKLAPLGGTDPDLL